MTQHWTDQTDTEADELYATMTEAEIRDRQDLTREQIVLAYEQRNDDAVADLRRQEDALTRAMLRRV